MCRKNQKSPNGASPCGFIYNVSGSFSLQETATDTQYIRFICCVSNPLTS